MLTPWSAARVLVDQAATPYQAQESSGESQGQSMANIPQSRPGLSLCHAVWEVLWHTRRPALPGKPGRQRLQRLMSDANEDTSG